VDGKEGTYTTAQPHHHIPIRIEAHLQLADIALDLPLAMLVGTGVLIFNLLEDGVHIDSKPAVNNQAQRPKCIDLIERGTGSQCAWIE
jgi:hypothetical protein